ncbi:MAG: hypothetical protein Kow00108_19360 [Calditrichia bacterium]
MKKLLVGFFLLMFSFLYAQEGKIAGIVTDAKTGEPLVGVNVIAKGTFFGAATDIDGYFDIVGMKPGTYEIVFTYIGYQTVTFKDVLVKSGLTTRLDVKMQTAALEGDEIVVVAERPIIQKDLTSSRTITTNEEIEALPVNDVVEIINLTPGFVDGHARGGRGGEVAYVIEGMVAQDPMTGGYDTDLPDFALQEVSVEVGGVSAEYGNAQSGIVSMTLAEGTPQYSGKVRFTTGDYGLFNKDWNDNHLDKKLEFTVGGPELLSHLFTGQKDKLRLMISGNISTDNGRVEHAFSRGVDLAGKLTYQINASHKLTLSGTYSQNHSGAWSAAYKQKYSEDEDGNGILDEGEDIDGDGVIDVYNMLNALPEYKPRSAIGSFKWMWVLSSDSYLESSASFYYTKQKWDVDESYFGGVNLTDNDRDGFIDQTGQSWDQLDVRTVVDPFGWRKPPTLSRDRFHIDRKLTTALKIKYFNQINKHHALTAGASGKYHDIYSYDIDLPSGGNLYRDDARAYPYFFEAFVEDKIEYQDFIMRIGLRADLFNSGGQLPGDLLKPFDPTDPNKSLLNPVDTETQFSLSPRIGVSHPITANDVIYFNYGKYTQIPNLQFVYRSWDFSGAFPIVGNPGIGYEETVSYEVGVKHSFNPTIKIEAKAFFKDITGLTDTRQYYYTLANYYTLYSNEDYGTARGFEATLRKIGGKYWDGQVSYSYQIAKGKSSSPNQNYSLTWANSVIPTTENYLNWDQRHTVTAYLNFKTPKDFKLFNSSVFSNWLASITFDYGSGLPYSPPQKTRVPLINTERFPWTSTTNLRLQKIIDVGDRYSLKTFIMVRNLFDKKNINQGSVDIEYWYNDQDGDGKPDHIAEGKYGNVYAYSEGRRVLMGIQFDF